MAEKILIMGESGTGKSTSIRNCDPEITAIINPVGKPLPFRGSKKFATLNGETDADKICDFMREQASAGKKIIIVDDFQYVLAVPYMNRIKETGWDKYNDFGSNYFNIIDICNELPSDVCVYYMTHCETLDNGLTTVKLIGKLLREKITVEGLFTIVLKTGTSEGKYFFFTQNSGKDTVKSPLGMFDSFSIDNDLAYVDAKIRNYYEFDDAVSDDQMAKLDELKAGEVEKPEPRRRRTRTTNDDKEDPSKPEISESDETGDQRSEESDRPVTRRRKRTAESEDGWVNIADGIEEITAEEKPSRRKSHDEVVAENSEKMDKYMEDREAAIDEVADGREEIPFDEAAEAADSVPAPELEKVPRRTRKERIAEAENKTEEKPKRTRKVRE